MICFLANNHGSCYLNRQIRMQIRNDELQEKSVWYPVSIEEMKGRVAVYLCMGFINKPHILSY